MKRINWAACLTLLFSAPICYGAEGDVRWNGYMNLTGGMLAHKADDTHPDRVGYENRFTGMQDSLFALQASKKLDNRLSITGQMIAQGATDQFKTSVNWAYVTYDINDNSSFRAGRLGLPTFYYSDFLYVGTAYSWITPPVEVYDFAISYQGVDYLRRDSFEGLDITTEVFAGAADNDVARPDGSTISSKSRDLVGVSFTFNTFDWLTARLMTSKSRAATNYNIDFASQLEAQVPSSFAGVIPDVVSNIKEALNTTGAKADYSEATLKADFDKFYFMSEFMQTKVDTLMQINFRRWYVSGGVRSGKFTYHLTFAKSDDPASDIADTFPYSSSAVFPTNQITQALLTSVSDGVARKNESWTLGLRVDTTRTTALKFEIVQFEEFASRASETAGIGKNTLARAAFSASF